MQDVKELRFILYTKQQVYSDIEGTSITPEMAEKFEAVFKYVLRWLACCDITEETAHFECSPCEMVVSLKPEITKLGFTREEVDYMEKRLNERFLLTFLLIDTESSEIEGSQAIFGFYIREE